MISNLKVTVTSRDKKEVKVEFDFTDAAADISASSPPAVSVICNSIYCGQAVGFARVDTLNMKDEKSGSIIATAQFTGFRPKQCALFVAMRDKSGNVSDDSGVMIDFNK